MSLPKYPEYKESRVDWIGSIPVHWNIRKFRHSFVESGEKIEGEVVGPMLSVSGYRGIEVKEYDDENRRRTDDELVGYRIVRPGQLVVNTMWLNYAGLGISDHEGHVSPAYRAYWIDKALDKRYVHYMMRSAEFVKGYTKFLTGVRPNSLQMSREDLMEFLLIEPPRAEQNAIAGFLDRETAKIDALIVEQEKLLVLLAEKRQATISHAVTRGLNLNASLKDSGIPWLGHVPAHWTIAGLTKFIGPIVDYRGRTPTKGDDGMFLVTAKNIRNGGINYDASEEYVDPEEAAALLSRGMPEVGDVLFTTEAPLGQVAQIDRTDIALAQRVVKFRGLSGIMTNDYLKYWLMGDSCQSRLETLATGSTALGIKASKLGMIECLAPPIVEQEAIVAFISAESERLDGLKAEAERAIDLLRERRSTLIAAAVTGQIDVRGVVEPQAE